MAAVPRRVPRSRLLIGLVFLLAAGAAEDENWQRLRSMPRERRLILSKKIEEFDRLDRRQKAELRALDEKLASLPTADQANYRAVMRRYHLWLDSLSADQKEKLSAAPAGEKLALVARFRAEQAKDNDAGSTPLIFQLADLRGRSPFEVAHMLEIWFALSPAQRTELEKVGVRERPQKLRELAKQVKIKPTRQLTKAEEDDVLKQMDRNLTKGFLRSQLRKTDTEKPIVDRHRLANNFYFLANPPRPVDAANLFRFESAMPSWFRTSFDHLPPEEAKRRLTILYRLIYPPGKEISQEPARPEAARPGPGPSPKSQPVTPSRSTASPPI